MAPGGNVQFAYIACCGEMTIHFGQLSLKKITSFGTQLNANHRRRPSSLNYFHWEGQLSTLDPTATCDNPHAATDIAEKQQPAKPYSVSLAS